MPGKRRVIHYINIIANVNYFVYIIKCSTDKLRSDDGR